MAGRIGARARARSLSWFRSIEGCFLLRDDFNGNLLVPLASPRRCRPGPGQLILDQTDGQFSIVAGEFVFPAQATPAWGDQDFYALDNAGAAYARVLGRVLKWRWRTTTSGERWAGWNPNNAPAARAAGEHAMYTAAVSTGIRCLSGASDDQVLRDLSPALNTYWQGTIVLGGSDGTLYWYPGVAGTQLYGARFFFKDETVATNHHLLAWYRRLLNTSPLYPAFSNYSSAGTKDYIRIPCSTFEDELLTPIVYDEFADTDAVTLPNHTITYGPGLLWVNDNGIWQIWTNAADPDATADARCWAETLTPDAWVEVNAKLVAFIPEGLYIRGSVDTLGGPNYWRCYTFCATAAADTAIKQVNDGVVTTRATADMDPSCDAYHNVRVRCDGIQITLYIDSVEAAHYASASFNRHATRHGLYCGGDNTAKFDNFMVLPRGTGLTSVVFDSMRDGDGKSLDEHIPEIANTLSFINPYQPKANEYKGQLHTHTTGSDGADTPAALETAYEGAGYDFVLITDHDVLTVDPGVAGILHIDGVEETATEGELVSVAPTINQPPGTAQTIINAMLADGVMASIAHPNWGGAPWTDKELQDVSGYFAIEIFNSKVGAVGNAETRWDRLLSRGNAAYGVAVDDCHNIAGVNFDQGWVTVFADALAVNDVKDALASGNFYSSTGPTLSISVSGSVITVSTPGAATIEWIGRGGQVVQSVASAVSNSYTVTGDEHYIRARVTRDADGEMAWTNPLYIRNQFVEDVGVWDIQTNEANPDSTADAHAYIESFVSDVWVTARMLVPNAADKWVGLALRKSADTGANKNYWYCRICNAAGTDIQLTEVNNGAATVRSSADTDAFAVNTRYHMSAYCMDAMITVYVDGTQRATYATATFNQTATRHGMYASTDTTARFDQFRITEIPALGEYDAALDSF